MNGLFFLGWSAIRKFWIMHTMLLDNQWMYVCARMPLTGNYVDVVYGTLSSFHNLLSNAMTYQDNKTNRNNSYSL